MSNHSMTIVDVPCGLVYVGERYRRDLGDLDGLAASIAAEGLLQPIGISADYFLIFGERRLRAVYDVLRQNTIPARVVDVRSLTASEHAENEMRKDFTPSERVAIARALEEEIGDRQGERTDLEVPENFPELEPGMETREFAAERAGFGNYKTYAQAKRVVENGVDELIEQMDSEELSINAAYLIADQPPERQREIAALPESERRDAVRNLRRKDLPTPAVAHEKAKETGKAILDRNLQWQTPMPMEERRPLIERNLAVMAAIDAIREIEACQLSYFDIANGIAEFDTPDMNFAGKCRAATEFLQLVTQELDSHAIY